MDQSPSMQAQDSLRSHESEPELKEMYTHKIVSSPDSLYTLEHKRQTPEEKSEEKKMIYCVRFDPEDSKVLAVGNSWLRVGFSDGCIGIYRVSNLEKIFTLGEGTLTEERFPVGGIRWRPKVYTKSERILVSATVDGVLNYWNPLNGKLTGSIKPEKPRSDLLCLDYTKDGTRLAAAGRRKAIKIFDDEKRVLLTKLRPKGQQKPGHSNRIFAVKFDSMGKTLITGGWDLTVKVWDVNSGTVAHSIYGPEINGDAIDLYEDGDLFVTGSHRSKEALQVWSLSYGKLVETIEWDMEKPGDSSLLQCAQFEKGGSQYIAACGSGRNEARIFEKGPKNTYSFSCGVVDLPLACSSIDLSSTQNLLAVGCCDGRCRLFERVKKSEQQNDMEFTSVP
eukprot:TRINITY_DN1911_c0_g2_i2.p1 TRINITY_DN1911_c0_g2~~TRINITY_DN1911_c0_g2_i2.p1  ORF type:complete len:392 (-),score=69.96 TRINITY_DN1911_c0_g2_i2:157-1332(-)